MRGVRSRDFSVAAGNVRQMAFSREKGIHPLEITSGCRSLEASDFVQSGRTCKLSPAFLQEAVGVLLRSVFRLFSVGAPSLEHPPHIVDFGIDKRACNFEHNGRHGAALVLADTSAGVAIALRHERSQPTSFSRKKDYGDVIPQELMQQWHAQMGTANANHTLEAEERDLRDLSCFDIFRDDAPVSQRCGDLPAVEIEYTHSGNICDEGLFPDEMEHLPPQDFLRLDLNADGRSEAGTVVGGKDIAFPILLTIKHRKLFWRELEGRPFDGGSEVEAEPLIDGRECVGVSPEGGEWPSYCQFPKFLA